MGYKVFTVTQIWPTYSNVKGKIPLLRWGRKDWGGMGENLHLEFFQAESPLPHPPPQAEPVGEGKVFCYLEDTNSTCSEKMSQCSTDKRWKMMFKGL